MATNQGIRGIRQTIPSGYMIGRQSPGSSKGAPGLIPLPPLNQQPIIAGSGGKATQGGGTTNAGTVGTGVVTVAGGTGINVTGAPAYTVALQVPVTVADGGTNATTASGTSLDNITGFSSTGILKRTGVGTYTFIADGQLPATATNDDASAGNVGEYITLTVTETGGSQQNMSNGVQTTIITISLTAGDWDVSANLHITESIAGNATQVEAGIVTTLGALPALGTGVDGFLQFDNPLVTNVKASFPLGVTRMSFASTTPVYLVAKANFGSGTVIGYGTLSARRAR